MPQVPLAQVLAAFVYDGQAPAQAPQLFRSVERSWQLEVQQVSPLFGHACVALQPVAQALLAQI
jgi:hypothetical protein